MPGSSSADSVNTAELEEEPLVVVTDNQDTSVLSSRVKAAVCLSHALSTWSERSWAFAVGLIFLDIYKDSLFYVSLFGLTQALASMVFSPSVGVYIDRTSRFKAVCVFYFIQNLGLILAALATFVLLSFRSAPSGTLGTVAVLAVVAFGILSRVGTMGGTIAIEKDWAKALAGHDSQELAKLNSTLKTIDLVCLIVAPIVSGFLMSYCSMEVATVQILIYNLLAWFPEVVLLKYATLHAPQLSKGNRDETSETDDGPSWSRRVKNYFQKLSAGFGLYFRQSCALASLSLSVLHLTVLSFGILMTAYLKWLGLSEASLSLYRGFAALTGTVGAKVFPNLHARWGLRSLGFMSIACFFTCVFVGALPNVIHLAIPVSSVLRFNFLVWTIAVSRFALWVFDLSVSQIIQEWVDESELGRVSAVQKFLENTFGVFIFLSGIAASRPQDFIWLMIISVMAVFTGFVLYTLFYLKSMRQSNAANEEMQEIKHDPVKL